MKGHDGVEDRLTAAALVLAAEHGWQGLSLVDVARRAEVPLVDCYRVLPDRATLLHRLLAGTDEAVLRQGPADLNETPRDRLFDVLMRRFDSLQSRRAGMLAILRGLPLDPANAATLLPRLARSLRWMLDVAAVPTAGVPGALRLNAVCLVYLYALRAWMDDDTADMARTMAALDKALRQADQLLHYLPGGSRPMAPEGGDPPAPPESPLSALA